MISPLTKDNAFKKKATVKYMHDGKCPFCSHEGVTFGGKEEADGNIISHRIRCDSCQKQWWEISTLTNIDVAT